MKLSYSLAILLASFVSSVAFDEVNKPLFVRRVSNDNKTQVEEIVSNNETKTQENTDLGWDETNFLKTTFQANNGGISGGGIYWDLTTFHKCIEITGWDFNTDAKHEVTGSLYWRWGSAKGYQGTWSGWKQLGYDSKVYGQGNNNPTRFRFGEDFKMDKDTTIGFGMKITSYDHETGHRYTGTPKYPPYPSFYADSYLQLIDQGANNRFLTPGGLNFPRMVNTRIHYTFCDNPEDNCRDWDWVNKRCKDKDNCRDWDWVNNRCKDKDNCRDWDWDNNRCRDKDNCRDWDWDNNKCRDNDNCKDWDWYNNRCRDKDNCKDWDWDLNECRDDKDKKKDKKSSSCFSSTNSVQVEGKGVILMDKLKIGDVVQAGRNKYSRVYSFLHLDRDVEAEFLQIHADGLTTPLEVTPEHMVYIKNVRSPVPASEVKVGDMLGNYKVNEIKMGKRRGVYAPVTESGDIIVNGVLASSYASLRPYSLINPHAEAHTFFAIRRLVCAMNFRVCEKETYTDDGFPEWLWPMVRFALSTKHNAPAQVVASVVGLPVITAVYILEQMILYPLVVGMFIIGALFAYKKINSAKTKVQ